jgi:hypothetical protein
MLKNIIPLILFFLLTPGILWTYSKKHNKYSIALLHACVFAFVFYLIETFSNTPIREGLTDAEKNRIHFLLASNLKSDEGVRRKIKKEFGENTRIEYKEEDEKDKNKSQINMDVKDATDGSYFRKDISKPDIMTYPKEGKIKKFIKEKI